MIITVAFGLVFIADPRPVELRVYSKRQLPRKIRVECLFQSATTALYLPNLVNAQAFERSLIPWDGAPWVIHELEHPANVAAWCAWYAQQENPPTTASIQKQLETWLNTDLACLNEPDYQGRVVTLTTI